MRRTLGPCVLAALAVACHPTPPSTEHAQSTREEPAAGATTSTATAEVEVGSASSPLELGTAATPEASVPASPRIDSTLFGCTILGQRDGALLRHMPHGRGIDFVDDPNAAVPFRFWRELRPAWSHVRVIGPSGPCEPRLGEAAGLWWSPGFQIVGHRFGGCGRELAAIALADCEVPAWLRYRRPTARIETLPRRGPLDDPLLEALARAEPPFPGPTEEETAAQRGARLRRRVRRSVLRTEQEELLVLELHSYLEGMHECSREDEDVRTWVGVRRVDGDAPGPWEELHPSGRLVGAFLDEAGRVVALDTVRTPPVSHRCEGDDAIGLTCDLMVVEARVGGDLATVDIMYGFNWTWRESQSLLAWSRECSESG